MTERDEKVYVRAVAITHLDIAQRCMDKSLSYLAADHREEILSASKTLEGIVAKLRKKVP